ncbi:MAG: hypothetical protein PHF44_02115 [Candidatus Pacebacteria bacterium]|nr:hypothetical protein [Candidatus Paceibacterota bacterium]
MKLPITDLFKREITEELGKDVKYKILGLAINIEGIINTPRCML